LRFEASLRLEVLVRLRRVGPPGPTPVGQPRVGVATDEDRTIRLEVVVAQPARREVRRGRLTACRGVPVVERLQVVQLETTAIARHGEARAEPVAHTDV